MCAYMYIIYIIKNTTYMCAYILYITKDTAYMCAYWLVFSVLRLKVASSSFLI